MVLIDKYGIFQEVKNTIGLIEFSEEEYNTFQKNGMVKLYNDEQFFFGDDVEFESLRWLTTIGTTQNRIYKISLQTNFTEKVESKEHLKKLVEFLNKEYGKYTNHPFFSDRYFWNFDNGNILINRESKLNLHCITLIFTGVPYDFTPYDFLSDNI